MTEARLETLLLYLICFPFEVLFLVACHEHVRVLFGGRFTVHFLVHVAFIL